MDRFGLFGPGPDDRFDELAVGVLVAAVEKLAHRLEAVGALVVNAGEIQRGQRIVAGTDQEEAGKPAGVLIQRITKRGGLECRQLFAGTTAHIGAPGAQLVGTSRTWRGGDEDDLLCPGVCRLFEQAAQRIGTITKAVRFAAPGPLGAEPDQVRLGGDRDRQRCRERIDQMIASNAGEIECFQLPRAGFGKTAREEPGAMRRPEEGEDRVSARVHVVHRQ